MKVNEFRIGNLISIDDIITEVTGITKSTIYFKDGYQMFIAGGIEPIPLTEEWLIAFGFNCKYKSCHNHWNIGSFGIEQASDEDDYGNRIEQKQEFSYGYSYLPKLDFVHQLQNLYFALTGEELTYSPVEPPSR